MSDRAFAKAVDAMRRVGYSNVTSHLFPHMRHEILNETRRDEVWQHVLANIEKFLRWA